MIVRQISGRHLSPGQKDELRRRLVAGERPAQIAEAMGISTKTAQKAAKLLRGDTSASAKRLGGTPQDREIIILRDEVQRLKREMTSMHREEFNAETVRQMIGRIASSPVTPPSWLVAAPTRTAGKTSEVPVAIWSDWHMGETVSLEETNGVNEYNPDIAEARIRRLVESTINLCRRHGPGRYPGIVINLLGDFVSGGLHPELMKTDAEEPIPSVLRCIDILIWAIEAIAKEFKRVYLPCASGNHGRTTIKPEFKRYVYKNFDYLIYEVLARQFEGRRDIIIDNRPSNEVYYRVYNQRFLAMHGDMLGVKGGDGIIGAIGPIMRGEIKTRGQATSSGRDFDMLLIGHWHQPLWLPRAIVANTLKGFDEYAKNSLRAPPTAPSQPLWFVHPRRGITSRWDVKVDAPRDVAETEWVSMWRAAA